MPKTCGRHSNVLPFPANRIGPCDPDAAVIDCQIAVVPLARNWKFLAFVTDGMREEKTADAAEQFLIDHLDIEWGRLSRLGIAHQVKVRQCRDFSLAAWRRFFADRTEEDDVA